MKIYTKTGDKGTTALIGGTRVPKFHIRVEAYGTVDELVAHIGLILSQNIDKDIIEFLHLIQIKLMNISAILASDGSIKDLPQISDEDIQVLERKIDEYNSELEPIKDFILPGGHTIIAFCHIARTVCRRAERVILQLNAENPVPRETLIYMNRLSDFLFTLARKLHKDLDIKEYSWIS